MNADKTALEIAAKQGGVIRLDQAIAAGLSPSSIGRRVAKGNWQRIARAIYRILDMDMPLDRVRAAITALPRAVASHETAAELHSIPRLALGQAIVTVHSRTTHTFPGVVVHRTRDLDDDHTDIINGVPATSTARTIVDLSARLHPRHLEAIVDDLVAAKRLELAELEGIVTAIARRGKAGSTTLRDLIAQRRSDGIPLASRLERLGLSVLLNAGLPRPHTEYPAPWDPHNRLDAAYPNARIGIEWDSKRWHTQVASFERDRIRDREAMLRGWHVFRFTWQDVTERPHVVVRTVRTALQLPHSSS